MTYLFTRNVCTGMSYKSQVNALYMSSKANNNGKLYPEVGNGTSIMKVDTRLTNTNGYITTELNCAFWLLVFQCSCANSYGVLTRMPRTIDLIDFPFTSS